MIASPDDCNIFFVFDMLFVPAPGGYWEFGSRHSATRERSVKEPKTRAKGHERTRRDHATELTQDYVEAIAELQQRLGECRVRDLAERFAVSHVTVNRAVARMKRDGYVDTEPYAPVTLTDKGRSLAEFSHRRHEIVYQFLLALGVSQRTASIDSEGIEHHVSDETLGLMEKFGKGTAT